MNVSLLGSASILEAERGAGTELQDLIIQLRCRTGSTETIHVKEASYFV